jgi:hypothetical protein
MEVCSNSYNMRFRSMGKLDIEIQSIFNNSEYVVKLKDLLAPYSTLEIFS